MKNSLVLLAILLMAAMFVFTACAVDEGTGAEDNASDDDDSCDDDDACDDDDSTPPPLDDDDDDTPPPLDDDDDDDNDDDNNDDDCGDGSNVTGVQFNLEPGIWDFDEYPFVIVQIGTGDMLDVAYLTANGDLANNFTLPYTFQSGNDYYIRAWFVGVDGEYHQIPGMLTINGRKLRDWHQSGSGDIYNRFSVDNSGDLCPSYDNTNLYETTFFFSRYDEDWMGVTIDGDWYLDPRSVLYREYDQGWESYIYYLESSWCVEGTECHVRLSDNVSTSVFALAHGVTGIGNGVQVPVEPDGSITYTVDSSGVPQF